MFTRETWARQHWTGIQTHMQVARRSGDAKEFRKFSQRIISPSHGSDQPALSN